MTRRRPNEEPVALSLWSDGLEAIRSVPGSSAHPRAKRSASPIVSLEGLPLMLTIEEAAEVLRVSRTSAYKLVDEYRKTNGREGLPHVRLGGRLLVRRVDLAAIVGG
jgi:excisionase family DNA binding protein